jgi:hypothetical protein
VASWSIISPASTALTAAPGRNTTSAMASARMPPTPSITLAPNCGSRTTPAMSSRLPDTIGATSTDTGPSSGVAAASRSAAACSTAPASPSRSLHQAALGLVRDRVAAQLHHHGEAELGGRSCGIGGRGHLALVGHRHAVLAQQRLRGGLGQGVAVGRHGHDSFGDALGMLTL